MKMRNKGKVFPSPSPSPSSSSSSSSATRDVLSVLKLLPAAIMAIASVLSLEDREVLAYMMTRSIKSANPSSIQPKNTKKNPNNNTLLLHNPPHFHCGCFDCYRSYWFRWDSSPSRELIHQVIESFEEHLTSADAAAVAVESKTHRGTKKRDKTGRRTAAKPTDSPPEEKESVVPVAVVEEFVILGHEDLPPAVEEADMAVPVPAPVPTVVLRSTAAVNDKGLARKVLPDVMGLLNSRLWSLWSPNV